PPQDEPILPIFLKFKSPLALRTLSARRRCVGPINPLLGKEKAKGRLLMRHCITSPDPSLVRRGTFTMRSLVGARVFPAGVSKGARPGGRPLPGKAGTMTAFDAPSVICCAPIGFAHVVPRPAVPNRRTVPSPRSLQSFPPRLPSARDGLPPPQRPSCRRLARPPFAADVAPAGSPRPHGCRESPSAPTKDGAPRHVGECVARSLGLTRTRPLDVGVQRQLPRA